MPSTLLARLHRIRNRSPFHPFIYYSHPLRDIGSNYSEWTLQLKLSPQTLLTLLPALSVVFSVAVVGFSVSVVVIAQKRNSRAHTSTARYIKLTDPSNIGFPLPVSQRAPLPQIRKLCSLLVHQGVFKRSIDIL